MTTPRSTDRRWTRLIDEVCAERWINPETGEPLPAEFKRIDIDSGLGDHAAELIGEAMPASRYAVVSDADTHDALGSRVVASLGERSVNVVLTHPHADEATAAVLREKTQRADAVIAVGSGTVNDLCKYATALDGKPYSVFGTAASMNGYTSSTASITLDNGMKATLSAHAANAVFLDLDVSAAAPHYLTAAGFGDCLCRAPAQVDWYASHRLFGTVYSSAPYVLQRDDERAMLAQSGALARRDRSAIGQLHRWLTLAGLGISVVRSSHPGSMGEHQISHWIDNFAGSDHPGSVHGQQVGISSLTMARLHARILAHTEPPVLVARPIDEHGLRVRYPAVAFDGCLKAMMAKAITPGNVDALNQRLAEHWQALRIELLGMHVSPETLEAHLRAAGAATHPDDIGLDRDLYRRAVRHALEIRDRFSLLDLAANMRTLDAFVDECC